MKRTLFALMALFIWACGSRSDGNDERDTATIDTLDTDTATSSTEDSNTEDSNPVDTALDPFATWEEMLTALKASPDNLPAQAQQLTDPEEIFTFVRDSFKVHPVDLEEIPYLDMVREIRWGTSATLRGGAGTPREKVDLLASLLDGNGHSAQVYSCLTDAVHFDVQAMILDKPTISFEPASDGDTHENWRTRLQTSPAELSVIEEHVALAENLVQFIPDDAFADDPAFDWSRETFRIPLVGVQTDDGMVYLNPLLPESEWGDHPCTSDPTLASPAKGLENLTIHVEAAKNYQSDNRVTLVEGTWSADEVAGHRVQLSFPPYEGGPFRIPTLTVHGDEKRSIYGTPFTVGGDIVEANDSGEATLNGISLGQLDSAVDPNVVATQHFEVNTTGFPRNTIHLEALDSNGDPVPGLGADAFTITENGTQVPFVLRQNNIQPKVLMLFDNSGSLPDEFLGEGARQLGNDLANSIWQDYPEVPFRVGSVNAAPTFSGAWTTDPADLDTQLLGINGMLSNLWGALTWANTDDSPTIIVFVTDGQASSEPTAEQLSIISDGARVLTIAVGDYSQEFMDTVSSLTGGASTTAVDVASATAFLSEDISAEIDVDYEIVYTASVEGEIARLVTVEINGIEDTVEYTAPDTVRESSTMFTGLFLTVEVGNRRVERLLAGYDPDTYPNNHEPDVSFNGEVYQALQGGTVFAVEAGSPGLSVILTEMLKEKLALEEIWTAALTVDNEAVSEAMGNGFFVTPPELFLYSLGSAAFQDVDSLTFNPGLNVNSVTTYPTADSGVVRITDLMPFNEWMTIKRDGTAGWRETMERTAWLAIAEAANNNVSTLSELNGEDLALVESSFAVGDLLFDPEVNARWEWLLGKMAYDDMALVPSMGAPYAFWQINGDNGTLAGVLGNYTGGGKSVEEIAATFDETIFALDVIGVGGISGPLGTWAGIEAAKAKALKKATIAIATMDGSGEDWDQVVEDMLCSFVKAGVGTAVPPIGEVFDVEGKYDFARDYLGLAGPDAFPCPW